MAEATTLHRLWSVLFVMTLVAFLPSAQAAEFEYTVADGQLSVFGHRLEPQCPIKSSSPREDDDTSIGFSVSPSERWILIHVGLDVQTDLWLYDSQSKARPVRIEARPRGRHVFTKWRSDRIFEIQHAGMGYSESDFFRADDLTKKASVDGFIYHLDFERGLYVCYFLDDQLTTGVEVGRLFGGEAQKERFPVNLDVVYLSNANMAIEQVEIVGEKVLVTHRKQDGTLFQEAFSPELLTL